MRINAIDLRQLRYFVTVADELHFGRAAKRLNMSQPPLSQQIKALEEHLEVELFYRTQRKVALTAAGAALLPEARRLLADVTRLSLTAKDAAKGIGRPLRVGLNFSAPFHPFTGQLLPEFHRRFPQHRLELVLHDKPNLLQLVDIQGAQLDLALIWLDDGHKNAEIDRYDLAHDLLDVALPASHPLAKEPHIHIRQLVNEPFIGQPRHSGTQRYDGIAQAFDSIEAHPRVVAEALQMPIMMTLVAAGQGLTLLPRFLANIKMPGVVFRPLVLPRSTRAPCMTLNLIVSRRQNNEVSQDFIALCQELAPKFISHRKR
jgi:DNA-binding transcriptional LysR family regulator